MLDPGLLCALSLLYLGNAEKAAGVLDDRGASIWMARHRLSTSLQEADIQRLRSEVVQAYQQPESCLPSCECQRTVHFLHIPKSGGESIELALNLTKNHHTAMQRFGKRPQRLNDVIAVVRSPHERVLSWFKYALHGASKPGSHRVRGVQPKVMSRMALNASNLANTTGKSSDLRSAFELFVGELYTEPTAMHYEHLWTHGSSTEYLFHDNGQLAPRLVLRFEQLEADWKRAVRCGLGIDAPLDHINDSSSGTSLRPRLTEMFRQHPDSSWWYSPRAWCVVRQAFDIDYEIFGHLPISSSPCARPTQGAQTTKGGEIQRQ
jgi:hypothetical protein